MKLIQISKGHYTKVDDEDYETLSKVKWFVVDKPHTKYVRRKLEMTNGQKRKSILMHRQIMGLSSDDKEMVVDHIDGDGLNNCRSNLRVCTRSQNSSNVKKHKGSISKYLGVFYSRQGKRKWFSSIRVGSKSKHLGCFYTEEEAAIAYNSAAKAHKGEFAKLNVITI